MFVFHHTPGTETKVLSIVTFVLNFKHTISTNFALTKQSIRLLFSP